MSYRGRDLDLRTPERWQTPPGPVLDEPALEAAVLVDEAVLACCNHGYDLALAHRAREVRLEHLLNAMTRLDAAVSVMVTSGIDVASLRHDTASLIASDEAIIPGHERTSPRRSQLLADILHIAGDRARLRNAPVSISDILRAILQSNFDQPGVVMMKRNSPGWQTRTVGEPLPPLMSAPYPIDPRYAAAEARPVEPAREWVRVAVPQATYYTAPPPAPAGSITDVMQNSRLDQLERTIRELSGELAAERKAVAQLTGSEPMMMAVRPEPHTALPANDRLAGIERNVEAKFAEIARGWTVLGERLQSLEQAVNADREDAGLPAGLVDRLHGLETFGATMTALSDRLAGIERQLAARPAGAGVNVEPIVERLVAIEQAQTNRPTATVDLRPVLDQLQAIDNRVSEINRSATGLAERVSQFDRKLDAGSGAQDRTADRIRAIEEAMIAQRNQVAQLATSLTADVKALGQSVNAQNSSGERIQSLVGERFQSLSSAFDQSRSDIASAVAQPLAERLGAVEKLIQGFGQRTLDLHAAHGADLVELHNALVKLNSNQQTLAASMDQWRLDNGNELSTLLSRLDGVERANVKPLQMLENLQSNVQSLQRSTVKREEQRSRFKQWLMGTDDWYGASWEHGDASERSPNGTVTPPRPDSAASRSS